MILTIRTDNPVAEVGLYANNGSQLAYKTWTAHRELSTTLLSTVHETLVAHHAGFHDLSGIVVFRGPGSFTGLRIGITVANALAYSLSIPIAGSQGEAWQQAGLGRLGQHQSDTIVLPNYGAEAHVTPPRK